MQELGLFSTGGIHEHQLRAQTPADGLQDCLVGLQGRHWDVVVLALEEGCQVELLIEVLIPV